MVRLIQKEKYTICLHDANVVSQHFYLDAPYHYAIAVAGGTDTGDDANSSNSINW